MEWAIFGFVVSIRTLGFFASVLAELDKHRRPAPIVRRAEVSLIWDDPRPLQPRPAEVQAQYEDMLARLMGAHRLPGLRPKRQLVDEHDWVKEGF